MTAGRLAALLAVVALALAGCTDGGEEPVAEAPTPTPPTVAEPTPTEPSPTEPSPTESVDPTLGLRIDRETEPLIGSETRLGAQVVSEIQP